MYSLLLLQQQYHVVPMGLELVGSDLVYGDGQAGLCMALVHGMGVWGDLEMTIYRIP